MATIQCFWIACKKWKQLSVYYLSNTKINAFPVIHLGVIRFIFRNSEGKNGLLIFWFDKHNAHPFIKKLTNPNLRGHFFLINQWSEWGKTSRQNSRSSQKQRTIWRYEQLRICHITFVEFCLMFKVHINSISGSYRRAFHSFIQKGSY